MGPNPQKQQSPTALHIDSYAPARPGRAWQHTEQFVKAAVRKAAPVSVGMAGQYLTAVNGIASWTLDQGHPLEPEIVLSSRNIDLFFATVGKNYSPATREQRLQFLTTVAAANDVVISKRPPRTTISTVEPYSERELISFRSGATALHTERQRRNAHVLLGLGAGAGLRSSEIVHTKTRDIVACGDDLFVFVSGQFERLVLVDPTWVRVLRTGLENGQADEYAFAWDGDDRNARPSRALHCFATTAVGGPVPTARRLRATWLAKHAGGDAA